MKAMIVMYALEVAAWKCILKYNNTSNIGFEKEIWNAACILWGNMDASEYKFVVFGLISRPGAVPTATACSEGLFSVLGYCCTFGEAEMPG